ncbi:MAG: hypothetical protein ACK5LC_00710 [Coprobacillaceae bacterium]
MSIQKSYFLLHIEESFQIRGRDVWVVSGKIQHGKIHDTSSVVILNTVGEIIRETKVSNIDWFGRGKYKSVVAEEGDTIAVIFDIKERKYLDKGNYLAIL